MKNMQLMRFKKSLNDLLGASVNLFTVLTILMSCYSSSIRCQNVRIDSLHSVITSSLEDSIKVRALEKLQREYVTLTHYEEALKASIDMLELAIKVEDHTSEARAHAHVAYCYYFMGEYTNAVNWIKRAARSAEAWLEPIDVSTCYGNAGLVLQEMGQYDSALVYQLKCLAIRQEVKDTVHWAYTLYDIAELFIELGEYERAVEHHTKSLELRKQIPEVVSQYNVIEDSYRALAMAYHRNGNDDKAIELLNASLTINRDKKDVKREANSLRNFGEIAFDRNEFGKAKDYFIQSIALDASINNIENAAEIRVLLGRAWRALGKESKALTEFEAALVYATKMKLGSMAVEVHQELANTFSAQGNFSDAYKHLQLSSTKKDSLLNEQKVKALKEMEVRYQLSIKEAKIQELNIQKALADTEVELKAREAQETRWALLAVTLGSVLLVVLVFIVIRNNRNGNRLNQVLEEQKQAIEEKNDVISESLLEKESLLKEIHHRVKNNLQVISSLLNLQSSSLSNREAQEAIKEGQNRVKSIALIHQKLYQTEDLSQVDFRDYSKQLISFLSATFKVPNKKVETLVIASNIQLDIDTAVPLGLIINELVTNSYKYAFVNSDLGRIKVELIQSDDGLKLQVSDNGVGFPEELDVASSKTLGLRLIYMLSRQLKGTVAWQNEGGVHFSLSFQETSLSK
jgi:two-component sensor histidine kinase/glutamine amidotransferase PdxT